MKKRLGAVLAILIVLLSFPITVHAEESIDLKDCESILPVELYLTYENEERLLRSNYGILVGGSEEEGYSALLANAIDVQATGEELQAMYNDYEVQEEDYKDVHEKIKVIVEKDISIEATINNVSNSLNLAVLNLSSAVFGHEGITFNVDEGCVTSAQEVYIADFEGGYHKGYALNENIVNGVKYVQFDSPMDWEQSGLPLFNSDGEVLGMIQNSIDGIHKNALSSKEIVVVLKTLGVQNTVADHSIAEIDKKSLISATDVADKLDLSVYTEETANVMSEKIEEARSIIINDEATQEEVDLALANLLGAQEGLLLEENLSSMAIIFMIVSGVLFIGIVVIVVVLVVKKKKKKKKETEQAELELKKAPTQNGPYVPKKNTITGVSNTSFAPNVTSFTGKSEAFLSQKSTQLNNISSDNSERSKSVKLASMEGFAPSSKSIEFNEEDTTVLSVVEDEIKKETVDLGYLIRKSDGYRIELRKNPSILGKSSEKADYVIDGKAVSRAHLCIEQRGEAVYAKDMSSLNGSKLNQVKLNPEEERELKDGDELTLADVEFMYHRK